MSTFSLSRTQGIDAGMKVARASYIAGFADTSNVLAGITYGIPLSGTMAHSYISSYELEIDALRAFARRFPERSILLIDTYDTISGAHQAVNVAREMAAHGHHLRGVGIDSGDVLDLGLQVRRTLDEAGFGDVQIVGSGGLDESDLDELSEAGAPYDAYGVGTKMGVSADAPWTDMAYKLARYGERPVLKLSVGKTSLPDAKQVFRVSAGGRLEHDLIAGRDEPVDGAEPLLRPVDALWGRCHLSKRCASSSSKSLASWMSGTGRSGSQRRTRYTSASGCNASGSAWSARQLRTGILLGAMQEG